MADNLTLPATSSVILTDDCTTGHAQIIKLAIATDGNAALIPADGDGLLVNLGVNNDIVGNVPHDGEDVGYPVKIGARAVGMGSNPTAVAAEDRTDLLATRAGILYTIGGHPNVLTYGHSAITTAVTDSALISVSAGTRIVVTRISVTLDSASTVFPAVRIGFGTASVPALGNAGILLAHGGIPAGGGMTIGDGSGILAIGASDEDLRITTTGNATGGGLQVTVSYFTTAA